MLDDGFYKNLCYHSHNLFCDGKNTIEEMTLAAIDLEITHLGISSHAPLKIPNLWSLDYNKLPEYSHEIDRIKNKYSNKIRIYKALEIDYIPNYSYSFSHLKQKINLDYTIGSVHLVLNKKKDKLWFIDGNKEDCILNLKLIFDNDIQLAIRSYYSQLREMIRTQQPDIIGHLDKVAMNTAGVLFDENEQWYQEELIKTLGVIAQANAIIEINTRGIYKQKWNESFPSSNILKISQAMGIPIIFSADSHHTSELLGNIEVAKSKSIAAGYSHQMVFEDKQWVPTKIL